MATQKDYDTGAVAANTVIQAAIKADVPSMFQSEIPADLVKQLCAQISKAVVDAVDSERAGS